MSEAATEAKKPAPKKKAPPAEGAVALPRGVARKKMRKVAREKRALRLRTDKEFAKAYFDGRSKRSDAKKVAFRKRHSKKGAGGAA